MSALKSKGPFEQETSDQGAGREGLAEEGAAAATASLLKRCRQGDVGAWGELVETYGRLVYGVAVRYGLSPEDCDDVFQQVWTELWQSLDSIRHDDKLRYWLATVAGRTSWRLRRARSAEEHRLTQGADEEVAATLADPRPTPEEYVVINDRWQELEWALAQLAPLQRQLLHALFFEDRPPPYAELARRLEIPLGSVAPTRQRALRRLKGLLKEAVPARER